MNLYWTNKKHFFGLKHFVLVNKIIINNNFFVELVAVLDSNINLRILETELEDSDEWIVGWEEFSKKDSITDEYFSFKNQLKEEFVKEVLLEDSSPFNIS
tara:strand:+ start:998 stop:1297 length:300 start_codon:yes stop_codon:yes gene_type:complete